MLNESMPPSSTQSGTSRIALIAGLGGAAFVFGIVLTLGVVQLNAQKQQIAQMNQMVAQLSQQRAAEQSVTRTVAADLLSVSPQPSADESALVQIAPAPEPALAQPTSAAALVQLPLLRVTQAPYNPRPRCPKLLAKPYLLRLQQTKSALS